jgi:hypothetical protein
MYSLTITKLDDIDDDDDKEELTRITTRIENSFANIKIVKILREMSKKRSSIIKTRRFVNINRLENEKTLLDYTHKTIAIKSFRICERESRIALHCITMINLFKNSYTNCHYNSKNDRCSFRASSYYNSSFSSTN